TAAKPCAWRAPRRGWRSASTSAWGPPPTARTHSGTMPSCRCAWPPRCATCAIPTVARWWPPRKRCCRTVSAPSPNRDRWHGSRGSSPDSRWPHSPGRSAGTRAPWPGRRWQPGWPAPWSARSCCTSGWVPRTASAGPTTTCCCSIRCACCCSRAHAASHVVAKAARRSGSCRGSSPRWCCCHLSCCGCRCSRNAMATGSRSCCRCTWPCWRSFVAPGAKAHDGAMTAPAPPLPACVINSAAYDREGRRRDIGLDEISDVLAIDDGSFVWVGLFEPDEAVLAKLQEEFDLHALAVEDAHHAHQRPKLEAYGDSLFVTTNTAQVADERIRYGETHAFLGARYLVTVRHGASASYTP